MVNKIIWTIVLFIFVTILSPPTVLVLAVGLLPTGIAYICDKSDEKFPALCVGGINLCGTFPYLLSVWFEGHSLSNALDIVLDFFSLLVMYGAAGIGWAFYKYVPPIISQVLDILAKRRLAHLNRLQKKLVEDWGKLGPDRKKASQSENPEDLISPPEKNAKATPQL